MRENEFGQAIGDPLPDWRRAEPPSRLTIEGEYCRLEPLDPARHAESLFSVYDAAPDEREWTYLPYGPFPTEEAYRAHAEHAAAGDDPLHFAVVPLRSDAAVGTLALMRQVPEHGVIEVGNVVFSSQLARTRESTEAQFLLMRHVFDGLGYRRYEWKCDALNLASRRAAERLGFRYEGVFRQALVYRGRNRDTAWFSILDTEWPAARAAFEAWLDPANFDASGAQIRSLSMLRST